MSEPTFIPYEITQTIFLYPPPSFISHQVMATLTLPDMDLVMHIWYLEPKSMSKILDTTSKILVT